MRPIRDIISAPGAKGAIDAAAPTQQVDIPRLNLDVDLAEKKTALSSSDEAEHVENVTNWVDKPKDRRLDRALDWVVCASGSQPVFFFILAGILTWALLGIPYGETDDWAVLISDIQAIISYIFDSFLMRQLLNAYESSIRVSASLLSRNESNKRMLRTALGSGRFTKPTGDWEQRATLYRDFAADLPRENLVGRMTTRVSLVFGHIGTICFYWAGIFVWIGFGQYCGWSDTWQLYINSATSALMVLIFAFLAYVRERHNVYITACLQHIFKVDSAVELKLRNMTGDDIPNPTIVVPAPKMSRIQRAIFYYADLVGTLTGIAILLIVLIVWICIGPAMGFSSNWWLLIGTYAGLIGLHDGFVLRNVQAQFNDYEDSAVDNVNLSDKAIFEDLSLPDPANEHVQDKSLTYRLSKGMGAICAHEYTVIAGVVLIIGLIVGASAQGWSLTGQLLCNVPPSLIESFFMMILITGHNIAETKRRVEYHNVYLRRMKLLAYVEALDGAAKTA